MIRVLGIDVPRAAITELALRLHRNGDTVLADYIGHTIDNNRDELVLTRRSLATRGGQGSRL